jgi:hypothetical protein
MLGTTLIKMWRVRESTSRSSVANLKAIADGADFCFCFRGLTVLRRYYGHENETLATYGDFPDHSADTVITRNGDNVLVHFNMLGHLRSCGYIDSDKMISGKFKYKTDSGAEILELHPSLKTGDVSFFSITKTGGDIIASMIFNPDGLDGDYYNVFVFSSPE